MANKKADEKTKETAKSTEQPDAQAKEKSDAGVAEEAVVLANQIAKGIVDGLKPIVAPEQKAFTPGEKKLGLDETIPGGKYKTSEAEDAMFINANGQVIDEDGNLSDRKVIGLDENHPEVRRLAEKLAKERMAQNAAAIDGK